MNSRIEAAAKAAHRHVYMDDSFDFLAADVQARHTNTVTAALAAADSYDAANQVHRIRLDDATVERIADAVFPKATTPILVGFKQTHDEAWVLARDEHHATIRSILAAAVKEDG